jgi:hypothetical protein
VLLTNYHSQPEAGVDTTIIMQRSFFKSWYIDRDYKAAPLI